MLEGYKALVFLDIKIHLQSNQITRPWDHYVLSVHLSESREIEVMSGV